MALERISSLLRVSPTHSDYGKATREDIINGNHNPFYTYMGSKILAEEAAWKFDEEHPEFDLATSMSRHPAP